MIRKSKLRRFPERRRHRLKAPLFDGELKTAFKPLLEVQESFYGLEPRCSRQAPLTLLEKAPRGF